MNMKNALTTASALAELHFLNANNKLSITPKDKKIIICMNTLLYYVLLKQRSISRQPDILSHRARDCDLPISVSSPTRK